MAVGKYKIKFCVIAMLSSQYFSKIRNSNLVRFDALPRLKDALDASRGLRPTAIEPEAHRIEDSIKQKTRDKSRLTLSTT